MDKLVEIIRELFTRDLSTSPLETAIFLTVLFGFFALLVIANIARRKKESRLYQRRLEDKWDDLCEKYELTDEEKDYLEELSRYLNNPEKKYLLLSNYSVLKSTVEAHNGENEARQDIYDALLEKTGLEEKQPIDRKIPIQRRKNVRRQVDIAAKLAPIEHTTAHIAAKMLDLSSGGCKIENPGGRFNAGDDLKITFTFKGKTYKDIPCEVVRTGGAGRKSLHISFGHGKTG